MNGWKWIKLRINSTKTSDKRGSFCCQFNQFVENSTSTNFHIYSQSTLPLGFGVGLIYPSESYSGDPAYLMYYSGDLNHSYLRYIWIWLTIRTKHQIRWLKISKSCWEWWALRLVVAVVAVFVSTYCCCFYCRCRWQCEPSIGVIRWHVSSFFDKLQWRSEHIRLFPSNRAFTFKALNLH